MQRKLNKLADELAKDIEAIRNGSININQAKGITLLANASIRARLVSLKFKKR